jgi:hypothetical protein
MIKEFALDPDALSTWPNFRYFIEKFGIGQGRLIAQFPKNWKRLVYEAASRASRDVDLKRIEERLSQLGPDVLFRKGRPGGNPASSWLARAIVEHASDPFAGIIAAANPDSHRDVLLQADVHEGEPRFHVHRQLQIPRTAASVVACADVLLRYGNTIKWVDYMIDLSKPRWQRPFAAAIGIVAARGAPVSIEVHRDCGNDTQRTNLVHQFQEAFGRLRREGVTLSLYLHPERSMHDRFILSEFGGLSVGHGLDDNEDGGANPNANVSLLEGGFFEAQWKRFSDESFLVLKV